MVGEAILKFCGFSSAFIVPDNTKPAMLQAPQKTMRLFQKETFCSLIISLTTISSALPLPSHQARVKVAEYRAFCACIILTSLNKTTDAIPAQQLLHNLSDTLSTSDEAKCISWTGNPNYEIKTFADRFGKEAKNLSVSAGAFAPDIYAFCGPPQFGQVSRRFLQYFPLVPRSTQSFWLT